ncbi:DUF932 domain-containing protein [Hymenobacter sp. BT683]|uniref:DUF932 domain-containing protein n=1 Tax=Hymenobacter jeongseonensis TaxID=2791027 RepID=A0ABS0IM61_9BACT|nr:DUF932 domain-containing protein [Hymenobacter jeongseonensis]MBF9239462.1 DUF932 domain-containing protein [Hymenobacter jeongseonensis]
MKKTTVAAALKTALAAETTAQKLDLLLDFINGQYQGEQNLPAGSKLGKTLDTLRDELAAEALTKLATKRAAKKGTAPLVVAPVEAAQPATEVVASQSMEASDAAFVAQQSRLEQLPEPSDEDLANEALAEAQGILDAAVVREATPAPAPAPVHPVSAAERRQFRSESLDLILSAAVPASTKTYSPLSHLDLITSVKEQLDKRGLQLKDERYTQNRQGQQMFGHMTVQGLNGEQDMCLGFRNSYDKSMQVGVVGGSRVIVCSNMMFAGDFKALAMHNGNLVQELNTMLGKAADRLEEHYRKLQVDSEKMKQVEVNPRIIHEILGELFYSESVVSEAQLRIIRGELREKTNFGDGSLWDIYNHTTEALKTAPSGLIIGRHIDAHQFYMARA